MPKVQVKPLQVSTQIGPDCRLVMADSITALEQVAWHSVDLILTDPPYGISHNTNYREVRETPDQIHGDESVEVLAAALPILSGKLKSSGAMYCFCSPKNVDLVLTLFRQSSLIVKNLLVWCKNDWGAGDLRGAYGGSYELIIYAVKSNEHKLRRRMADILYATLVQGRVSLHPHQKPEKLLRKLIRNSSDSGDLVIDPFLGSGSTGAAAMRLGRRFWGSEIDKTYYQTSVTRLEKMYQGLGQDIKKPTPIAGGREI